MTRKHRLLTILLALALLLGTAALPATVWAAEPNGSALSAKEKADALHELGLLDGTGTNADGTPNYALDRTLTRAQGSTMLVYLLGKREVSVAQYASGAISSPFTDLQDWAKAPIAWLYTNGMANGTGGTTFTANRPMAAYEFATLVLRALGYGDSDFYYKDAMDFAVQKQVITGEQSAAYQADFRRAGLVEMCYNALYLKMKDSDMTLLEKLASEGVFDHDKPDDPVVEAKPITLTVKYTGGGTANPVYMEEQCLGNAVCADLDGDGKLEIVFGVRSIFCANAADGKLKWRIADSQTGGQAENGRVPFQILDWDGDGKKEIFAMMFSGTKATVNIIDAAGKLKTAWTIDTGDNIWAGYPADLDRDGKYELVIGVGVGAAGERGTPAVYVYDNNGAVRSGWPQPLGYGLYSNSITTVDLDGDGRQEILMTYDETQIAAFHADGTKVNAAAFGATWDKVRFFEGGDNTTSSFSSTRDLRYGIMGTKSGIIADDLDGDGKQEIIGVAMINDNQITSDRMASGTGTTFSGTAKYFAPYILNLDRTRYKNITKGFDWSYIPIDTGDILVLNGEDPSKPSAKINIAEPDYRPLTADLNGDGVKEILYTANDGQVHCFNLDGTEHGSWPFDLNSGASSVVSFASRPIAADVNGDGMKEVIFATYTPMGQNTERGKLYVLDYTGRKLAEVTLPPMFYTNVDPATYANGSQTTPVVADIDNDGKLEIVVATYNCGLVAYEIS